MSFLRKYGVGTGADLWIPIIKRSSVDFAVGADWTPAAGDVKISKDGAAAANIGTLPVALTMGNGAVWKFVFADSELQCKVLTVTVVDSATKAVEDQSFIVETFGHASAQYPIDLSDSVRMGLTALPNAAAEAAGGLFTRGTGAGQINQDANGRIDANTKAISGDATAADNEEAFFDGTGYAGTGNVIPTVTSVTNRVTANTDQIEGVDATNQIRDSIVTDATRFAGANIDAAISSRLSTAGYTAPDNAGISTISTNVSTVLNRIGAFTGSGINTILGFFRALMRKDAALTPSDVGGTFDNTTDSEEAQQESHATALTNIQSDTDDIQTRLPAALVGGRMDSSVGAMANNVLTAAAINAAALTAAKFGAGAIDATVLADNAITAAKLATDSVDADALSADALTEIFNKVFTTALTEAYAADGAAPTAAQFFYQIWQFLSEFAIVGTTVTVKKLDGTTTAMTFTLDSSSSPAAINRAT